VKVGKSVRGLDIIHTLPQYRGPIPGGFHKAEMEVQTRWYRAREDFPDHLPTNPPYYYYYYT